MHCGPWPADGSTWTVRPRNSGHRSRRSSFAPLPVAGQFGIGVDTAAEDAIVAGDNPERIHSEAAFAKLTSISPVPTGSGMTSGRHRINHGGHRQLNAAIYRTVIVRMRFHEPTIAYVARRTAEGKSKRDIIRCLKRYVIREVYHLIKVNPRTGEIAS